MKTYNDFIDYLIKNNVYEMFFSYLNYGYEVGYEDNNEYIPFSVEPLKKVYMTIRHKDDIIARYSIDDESMHDKVSNKAKYLDLLPDELEEIAKKHDDLVLALFDIGLKLVNKETKSKDDLSKSANPNSKETKSKDDLSKSANPNSKETTIVDIARTTNSYKVLLNLLKNPKCTPETVDIIFNKVIKSKNSQLMCEVITCPKCPIEKIGDYYLEYVKLFPVFDFENDAYYNRIINRVYDAVSNTKCPLDTLEKLSNLGFSSNEYSLRYKDASFVSAKKFAKIEKKVGRLARRKYNRLNNKKNPKFKEIVSKSEIIQKLSSFDDDKTYIDNKIKEYSENDDNPKFKDKTARIKISEEELLIDVNDHKEFNPKYITFLKSIDLSEINSKNLKVSGIDFRDSNILIDPQTVYMKDLSGSAFNDENIVPNAFYTSVNLCGSNMLGVRSLIGVSSAYVDEATLLPDTFAIVAGLYKER